jgi:adenine-specific DNA methylase
MESNAEKTGVIFGIQNDVPSEKGNNAQRREHDKKIGAGTMSRSGAKCPNCPTIMTMEDIRLEGKAGRLGSLMTAVVVDGKNGKEYRLPTKPEIEAAAEAEKHIAKVFAEIPFGLPDEQTPKAGSGASRAFSVDGYGFDKWSKLFTPRQLLALGTFVKWTRAACGAMKSERYSDEWIESLIVACSANLSRLADYSSSICLWALSEFLRNTFTRFALPITWDYVEGNPIGGTSGNFEGALDWVARVLDHLLLSAHEKPKPAILNKSATSFDLGSHDIVVTDPPYYDAIPYSDLMDFFYVWLRRTLRGLSPEIDEAFAGILSPKWDHVNNDGELIDDSSRFAGDKKKSKEIYEDGMSRAFQACHASLNPDGRLVIVFAHKQPDAWETLVSAIIRAGFVVDGSWPIQTEREARMRAYASAALSSSVWLVCKKRPETARPGWDNQVLDEMRANIAKRLREFWDAGIRGPDFVWAATGPALEAYSKHPVVKKANDPDQVMTVSEFLHHVRRIVVDFVVGRVLSRDGEESAASLDDLTTYYLLHRYDFGMEEAPVGACILYAISCGLSDKALVDQYDLLIRKGKQNEDEDEPEEEEDEVGESSGSKVKLKSWQQRKKKSMGYEAPAGESIPYIDQIHRLMHLWKAGNAAEVDDYLNAQGLRRNALFHHLLQSLIELADEGTEERSTLESISNHISAGGIVPKTYEQERIKS